MIDLTGTRLYCQTMDQKDYRLAAIMFTDIVGFSRMMEADEAGTLELMKFHNGLVEASTADHGGKVIKTIGDAYMLEFNNSVSAVKCAIDIQNKLEAFNGDNPPQKLILRIGVHLGDIYFFENDALGEGINIASRLQALSKPGKVCISQEVYNLVYNKVKIDFRPLGVVKLKNIQREFNAYEVSTNGGAEVDSSNEKVEPSKPSKSPSNPGASPGQSSRPEGADQVSFEQVKAAVLNLTKQTGRRLSRGEVLNHLAWPTPKIEKHIDDLVGRGFIAKHERTVPSNPGADKAKEFTDQAVHFVDKMFDRFEKRWKDGKRPENYRGPNSNLGRENFGHGMRGPQFPPPRHQGISPGPDFGKFPTHPGMPNPQHEAEWDRLLAEKPPVPAQEGARDPAVGQYLQSVRKSAEEQSVGLRAHLGSFLGVSALLTFINVSTTAFPWAPIPILAWGIGIASHAVSARQKRRELAELETMPDLNREKLQAHRKLSKARMGWFGHLTSNVMTAVLLGTINLITSAAVPWALIPIGAMSIGLFSHYPGFKNSERKQLKKLEEMGVSQGLLGWKGRRAVRPVGTKQLKSVAPSQQAEELRSAIARQAKKLKDTSVLGGDYELVLHTFVDQMKELEKKGDQLEKLIASIDLQELQKDRERLVADRQQAGNDKIEAEYDKAIEQLDVQIRSKSELENEREMINLRLKSSLNSLKQMQIDVARIDTLGPQDEHASLDALRDKSKELNTYLEDLREGFKELG